MRRDPAAPVVSYVIDTKINPLQQCGFLCERRVGFANP